MRADAAKGEVLARPNDEESQSLLESVKPLEVQVSSVHDVDGAGFGNEFVEDVNLVYFRGCNVDEGRNVAMQIEQGVHLHGGVLRSVPSPGKERKTKVDGGAVQSVDGLLQLHSEIFVGIQGARRTNQHLRQVGVDSPVASLVGIGQRAVRDVTAD